MHAKLIVTAAMLRELHENTQQERLAAEFQSLDHRPGEREILLQLEADYMSAAEQMEKLEAFPKK